ncbi:hypothetical protein VZT92_022064 [Zoarces viviparus]|uniref:Secreted protein n=1 Tax=Zoarces viviparus TaxID=48416 RepID=A0AAW1EB38_ZOAVI
MLIVLLWLLALHMSNTTCPITFYKLQLLRYRLLPSPLGTDLIPASPRRSRSVTDVLCCSSRSVITSAADIPSALQTKTAPCLSNTRPSQQQLDNV